jgi:DNA modification methylase
MYNVLNQALQNDWAMYHGDSVEVLQNLPDECVHLWTMSPPFLDLFSYTPTARDLSNSRSVDSFLEHFEFIVRQMLRTTYDGRIAAIHVADVPARKSHDGYMGLKDFSGQVIRLFEKCGWIFTSRIPIDKNQQAQAIRTRSHQLTMTQMRKDRSWLRPALPDYILKFRKPGENKTPVRGGMYGDEWIELANPNWPGDEMMGIVKHSYAQLSGIYNEIGDQILMHGTLPDNPRILAMLAQSAKVVDDWRRRTAAFAENGHYPESEDACLDVGSHATWYGIEESDTLQGWQRARADKDELHVCPLQLQTIERCIRLWSNPGEIVCDPFAGIGSTGYVALLHDRKFIGCELKTSYYNMAVSNLERGQRESKQEDLFSLAGIEVE